MVGNMEEEGKRGGVSWKIMSGNWAMTGKRRKDESIYGLGVNPWCLTAL